MRGRIGTSRLVGFCCSSIWALLTLGGPGAGVFASRAFAARFVGVRGVVGRMAICARQILIVEVLPWTAAAAFLLANP